MITLYTSVGRFELYRTANGNQLPVITTHTGEHYLDIPEMIIWSSLMWNIMTIEELRPIFYQKEHEAHVLSDMNCEEYVERLISRGLIVSGREYSGDNALYKLVCNLHIKPVSVRISIRIISFFKFILFDHMQICKAAEVFKTEKLTAYEKTVMLLVSQEMLTTAELIMCIDKGVCSLDNHDILIETLYNDESTNCKNIAVPARFCEKQQPVLQTVAELYLRKQLIFEKIL